MSRNAVAWQPGSILEHSTSPSGGESWSCSAKQVGPAFFYSLIIIVVSFLPVFLLEAQEGRMFRPLAWTKTLALDFFLTAVDHTWCLR